MAKSSYALIVGGNSSNREENDYYATPPRAIDDLLSMVKLDEKIWEPACGGGHLSSRLKGRGYRVYSSDLIDRGYEDFDEQYDFINGKPKKFDGDIVTNPPFKYASDFIIRSLDSIKDGHKACMFLKLQFLEGQTRKKELFSRRELKHIFVYSKRITTAKNGDFDKYKSTALCNAWFVWEKGYDGLPSVDWI
ncbi:DNA methyltransferase family protein [Limosilactobacillus fermentum]|uniref:NAD(P)-dependent oxidoreductase n=1 Tax=Limosilactobacillus fermentum TaxID=1613 RepID=UPI0021CB68E0|nr:NAD(P)-dependent oxidoreductase [Limosilactobacillus fermentum]